MCRLYGVASYLELLHKMIKEKIPTLSLAVHRRSIPVHSSAFDVLSLPDHDDHGSKTADLQLSANRWSPKESSRAPAAASSGGAAGFNLVNIISKDASRCAVRGMHTMLTCVVF